MPRKIFSGDLKTNNQAKCVRFGGYMENTIANYNQGFKEEYYLLLNQILDPSSKSSQLVKWYADGISVAHMLDKRHEKFVDALLKVRWTEREVEVMTLFHKFVIAVITANPIHLHSVIKSLTSCFLPGKLTEKEDNDVGSLTAAHETIHSLFRTMFTLIPQSTLLVEKFFIDFFPFMKKTSDSQVTYVKNLLFVTTYHPSLSGKILELVIKNLVKLDVHCLRHEIEEAEEKDANQDIFDMDEDTEESPSMKHDLANKLDLLMNMLLQYMHDISFSQGELQLMASRVLFRQLVSIFDDVILPVHKLSHVQFIIFYICSIKQSFCETFIDHCWGKVIDLNSPSTVRQASVCYIASFLARANFISLAVVRECLDLMVGWAQRYLRESTDDLSSEAYRCDVTRHRTFYCVCQAVFYIVVFRHQQIIDSKLGYKYIESLNLQHLVLSQLNPLKACLSSVVTLFASTMRSHQLVYCDSIIERNNRQMIPVVGATITGDNPLESFFPFDPYLLKRSSSFISPLYTDWKGSLPVERNQEEFDDEFLDTVENGEYSTSMEGSHKICSISPGFAFSP